MNDKQPDFSSPDSLQLLRSPQARMLMEQLQQMDPALLQKAAALACSGDGDGARALLQPMLKDSDTRMLTDQMEECNGGF